MPLFSSHREPSPEPIREVEPVRKNNSIFKRRSHEPVPVQEPIHEKKGLFHRRSPSPIREPIHEPKKSGGLFHRRSPSPTSTTHTTSTSHSSRRSFDRHSGGGGSGVFRSSTDASSYRKPNILQRGLGRHNDEVDPTIVQARERVMGAEAAETEADRALDEARKRVREAREHMKRVEEEVAEEARRIKVKQQHAAEVGKRSQGLGRHGV